MESPPILLVNFIPSLLQFLYYLLSTVSIFQSFHQVHSLVALHSNFPTCHIGIFIYSLPIYCNHCALNVDIKKCKPHSWSSLVCEHCFIHIIKCIPHQSQQGKRNDINRWSKRSQHRTKVQKSQNFQKKNNSEESDLSTPTKCTLPKKIQQVPNQRRRNETRKQRATGHP